MGRLTSACQQPLLFLTSLAKSPMYILSLALETTHYIGGLTLSARFELAETGSSLLFLPKGGQTPVEEYYTPPHLSSLVKSIKYKRGWEFYLQHSVEADGSGGLALHIISFTPNSFNFDQMMRVNHAFLVPPASYKRDVWAAWIFDRVRDVETHEAGEFFRIDGVREFAPHHSNGEDPYRVWHVSDWATASKSSGEE